MSLTDIVTVAGAYCAALAALGSFVGALVSVYQVIVSKSDFRTEFGFWSGFCAMAGGMIGLIIGLPIAVSSHKVNS